LTKNFDANKLDGKASGPSMVEPNHLNLKRLKNSLFPWRVFIGTHPSSTNLERFLQKKESYWELTLLILWASVLVCLFPL